jgi:hypothetical protein
MASSQLVNTQVSEEVELKAIYNVQDLEAQISKYK